MRDNSFARSYSLNAAKGAFVLKRSNTEGQPNLGAAAPIVGVAKCPDEQEAPSFPNDKAPENAVSSPAVRCNPDLSRRADQWAPLNVGRQEEDVYVGLPAFKSGIDMGCKRARITAKRHCSMRGSPRCSRARPTRKSISIGPPISLAGRVLQPTETSIPQDANPNRL